MSRRTEKVASLLQHEIGDYILRSELPALTTVSKVEVTPDLKWCKAWITIMGDEKKQKEVLDILNGNLSEMQKNLNRKLTMKFVPKIRFVIDHGQEYADHINKLLKNI